MLTQSIQLQFVRFTILVIIPMLRLLSLIEILNAKEMGVVLDRMFFK